MKITPRFKKVLMWTTPILAASALTTGLAVSLSQHTQQSATSLTSNPSLFGQSYTSTVANTPNKEYVNQNSVVIMFTMQANYSYVSQLVSKIFKANPQLIPLFKDANKMEVTTNNFGTGWLMDYSPDKENQNLATYYLASNIHVLQLCYSVTLYNAKGEALTLSIPINKQTVDKLKVYISQPQGNKYSEYDGQNIESATGDQSYLSQTWYQLDNFDIIPIGAINNTNTTSYPALVNFNLNSFRGAGVVDPNYSIQTESSLYNKIKQQDSKNYGKDIAILKTKIDTSKPLVPKYFKTQDPDLNLPEATTDYYTNQKREQLKAEFTNINNMFSLKKDLNHVNTNSTYLTKLRYLNQQVDNHQINKNELLKLFPFANWEKADTITVGGFPGKPSQVGSSAKFNVGEVNHEDIQQAYAYRSILPYWQNGELRVAPYDKFDNYFMNLKQLTPGSSGSMVINKNNQIVGILWGLSGSNQNIMTPLFENNSNVIYNYLKYQNEHDKNSQLLKLFTSLYNYKNSSLDVQQNNKEKQNNNQNYVFNMFVDNNGNVFYSYYFN